MLLRRKLVRKKYNIVVFTRKDGDRFEWCKYCKYWKDGSRLCRDIYINYNYLYNICCDVLSKISKACRSVIYSIEKIV